MKTLDRLVHNVAARVHSRDPLREKRAKRMERKVEPVKGKAVIILGYVEDEAEVLAAWKGRPIKVLSIPDLRELQDAGDHSALITQIDGGVGARLASVKGVVAHGARLVRSRIGPELNRVLQVSTDWDDRRLRALAIYIALSSTDFADGSFSIDQLTVC